MAERRAAAWEERNWPDSVAEIRYQVGQGVFEGVDIIEVAGQRWLESWRRRLEDLAIDGRASEWTLPLAMVGVAEAGTLEGDGTAAGTVGFEVAAEADVQFVVRKG